MINICKRRKIQFISILIIFLIFISLVQIIFYIHNSHLKSSFILKNNYLISDSKMQKINSKSVSANLYKNTDWRIQIEKINLDAPILEGTSQSVLRKGVGHFENSGISDGNICLAAHNRGYKYNYFQEIKKLDVKDTIKYIYKGNEKVFEVVSNNIIQETDLSVLDKTEQNQLTLITCEENKKEYRRCIIAKEKI